MPRRFMSLAIAGCLTLLAVAAPAMAMTASHIDYRWPDFIDAAARLQIEGELRALDIEPVAVATAEQVRIYQLRRVARLSDDRLALSPAPIGSDLSV